jgi:hypothetical protein
MHTRVGHVVPPDQLVLGIRIHMFSTDTNAMFEGSREIFH